MNKTFKRAGIVAGGVGAIASISLASFAFFTATSSVTAQGDADTVQAATARDAVVGPLRPGSCEDVRFTLDNPNEFPLNGIYLVNTVDVRGNGGAAGHLHLAPYLHAGSTATDLVTTGGYEFKQIPAGDSQQIVFKNAVCMDLSAPDSAQGQTVTVDLNVSLKQANGTEYTSTN